MICFNSVSTRTQIPGSDFQVRLGVVGRCWAEWGGVKRGTISRGLYRVVLQYRKGLGVWGLCNAAFPKVLGLGSWVLTVSEKFREFKQSEA